VALGGVQRTLDRDGRRVVVEEHVAGHRSQRLGLDAHRQRRTDQRALQQALARGLGILLEQQDAGADDRELGRVGPARARARRRALSRGEQDPRVVRAHRRAQGDGTGCPPRRK
jgi:hypothetical protein